MRVISGRFKGHKLVSFDEDHIRPTTDRVKQSVFNILDSSWEGAHVLDLFSGTGSLGLEAYSRGATQVDMVEISAKSIAIIEKNLERLKITEGIKIRKANALDYVKKYKGKPYDIILIDPPFPLKICSSILTEISESDVASPDSEIIIEHSRHEPLEDHVGRLRSVDSRSYGDKLVTFYKKEG